MTLLVYPKKTLSSLEFIEWQDDLKDEAKEELMRKSDGMFQYVSCQFDTLAKLGRAPKSKIRQTLKDLPIGLDKTYDRMLASIDPNFRKQVARVLEWLAFSLRPLGLDEVAEIFILDPRAEIPFDDDNRLQSPRAVMKYLSGLVLMEDDSDLNDDDIFNVTLCKIRLAHFSIKEFLVSNRISLQNASIFAITKSAAHLHITESCLAYHLHLSRNTVARQDMLHQYRLWSYVSIYWTKHLDRASEEICSTTVMVGAMLAFIRSSPSLSNLVRMYRIYDTLLCHESLVVIPLHYACYVGAFRVAESLIGSKSDITMNGIPSETLYVPAVKSERVRKIMWDTSSTDVNEPREDYRSALNEGAACNRDPRIVQLLLDSGANVNATDNGCYGSVLEAAVLYGAESSVLLLLERGANVNAKGGRSGSALQAAASRGREQIVRLLLDKPDIDVNMQGGEHGSALQEAVFCGNINILQLLLDRPDIDVNVQGGRHGSALQVAVYNGHLVIVELLLARLEIDVNAQRGLSGSALQAAVGKGHLEILQLLLARPEIDVHAKGFFNKIRLSLNTIFKRELAEWFKATSLKLVTW